MELRKMLARAPGVRWLAVLVSHARRLLPSAKVGAERQRSGVAWHGGGRPTLQLHGEGRERLSAKSAAQA